MKWSRSQVAFSGLESGVAGVCAASDEDRPRWFIATRDGRLRGVDLDDGQTFFDVRAAESFEAATLAASADGRFVAIVETYGMIGALYDVASSAVLRVLQRGDYHPEVSAWAIGFACSAFVHATEWNRLEMFEVPSMKRLAPASDETKLDYFYGLATVSPDRRRLASSGWYWHPVGAARIIDVADWLSTHGEPAAIEFPLTDWWDDSLCWVDDTHVALRGAPAPEGGEAWYIEAAEGVLIIDATTGEIERFLPGITEQKLWSDGERIFALGEVTQVFDARSGVLLSELSVPCVGWHRGSRTLLSISANELAAVWLTGTITPAVGLPEQVTDEGLLVLGDALEEMAANEAAIAHCRAHQAHGRRCWVAEALRSGAEDAAVSS